MVKIKRIYEEAYESDGYRILTDRLWPRGLKKEAAYFDEWLKGIAPSNLLRKWFNHDPDKWQEFQRKYFDELERNEALTRLRQIITSHKTVTLLYAAKDEKHNHAAALKEFAPIKKLSIKKKT